MSRKKRSFGERSGNEATYKEAKTNVTIITILEAVLILLFFALDPGRNLIMPFFKPRRLNWAIKAVPEIIVVARPICSAVYRRAFRIQNINPKLAVTTVLAMRYREFLYNESLMTCENIFFNIVSVLKLRVQKGILENFSHNF